MTMEASGMRVTVEATPVSESDPASDDFWVLPANGNCIDGVPLAMAADGAFAHMTRGRGTIPVTGPVTGSVTEIGERWGDLSGHPNPAIEGHLKTGHSKARDIDSGRRPYRLRRHEQCLERREETASHRTGEAWMVFTTHRASHWCP